MEPISDTGRRAKNLRLDSWSLARGSHNPIKLLKKQSNEMVPNDTLLYKEISASLIRDAYSCSRRELTLFGFACLVWVFVKEHILGRGKEGCRCLHLV